MGTSTDYVMGSTSHYDVIMTCQSIKFISQFPIKQDFGRYVFYNTETFDGKFYWLLEFWRRFTELLLTLTVSFKTKYIMASACDALAIVVALMASCCTRIS